MAKGNIMGELIHIIKGRAGLKGRDLGFLGEGKGTLVVNVVLKLYE